MGSWTVKPSRTTDFASAAFRIPATPAEIGIARAVADVLGLDQVGADDSFFELGGDSLSATRVIARINAALHTNMGVNALFDGPVVADLAASIDPIDSAPGEPGPEEATRVHITSRARPERIPLSFAAIADVVRQPVRNVVSALQHPRRTTTGRVPGFGCAPSRAG